MNRRFVLLAVLLVIALGLLGCKRSSPVATSEEEIANVAPIEKFHEGPPLTDEECQQFAVRLEKAARSGNQVEFSKLFDWEALLYRSISSTVEVPGFRKGFIQGVARGQTGLSKQIVEAVTKGGSYRLLRVRTKDGQKQLLFRLLFSDGALNYQEVMLVRRPGGKIRVIDMYVYLTGEPFSSTVRRLYLPVAAEHSRGQVGKLFGSEQELVKHLPTFQKLTAAVQQGNHAEALRLYSTLPPDCKKKSSSCSSVCKRPWPWAGKPTSSRWTILPDTIPMIPAWT
jgi:hypothetical protein